MLLGRHYVLISQALLQLRQAARPGSSALVLACAAEYTEEKLFFTNPKGERLVGLLFDTGSEDVVILCHG